MPRKPVAAPAGTRGRILAHLRVTSRTVAELTAHAGISDNAVRTHLASLQRDGMVEDAGTVHEGGVGKPAQRFRITEQGEERFPKAYAVVLSEVLRVIAERDGDEALLDLLREVGRRAAEHPPSAASRIDVTTDLLRGLGADIELHEQAPGRWSIEGRGCPLSAVVRNRSRVCALIESLIASASGGAVTQRCVHGDRPRCSFLIESA